MEAHPVVDSQIVKWLNGGVGHFPPWDAFMKALVSDYLVPVVGGLALLGLWFWGSGGRRFGNQLAAVAAGGAMGFASLADGQIRLDPVIVNRGKLPDIPGLGWR